MLTSTLDRLGRNVDRTLDGLQDALARAQAGDSKGALAHLYEANETCQSAHLTLLSEGAAHLEGTPYAPAEIPLHLLDTAATRRTLDAAEFLLTCAKDVDKERGHVMADGTPCGLSDAVEDLVWRLRSQIVGPQGKE